MVSSIDEDAFLDEVLGLFVLEAQEWISQSNTALLELEHHPASDRKAKLYETISCGITNLGGSAATVELRDLEKLAFSLLPLLQSLRDRSTNITTELLAVLRQGLNTIITTVQNLSETKTGKIGQLDGLLKQIDAARQEASRPNPDPSDAPPTVVTPTVSPSPPSTSVIDKLTEFQRHAASCHPTRHMVEAVIRKAKKDYGERGWRHIDGQTARQIVQELHVLDEQFLEEMGRRVPAICGVFSDLKSPHAEKVLSNGRFEKLQQEVYAVHDAARTADAKSLMLFFHGLQAFLTILSEKSADIPPHRIEAVESRLQTVLASAQQWVELGKMERLSIQQILASN